VCKSSMECSRILEFLKGIIDNNIFQAGNQFFHQPCKYLPWCSDGTAKNKYSPAANYFSRTPTIVYISKQHTTESIVYSAQNCVLIMVFNSMSTMNNYFQVKELDAALAIAV
jgi:hypothetical protein